MIEITNVKPYPIQLIIRGPHSDNSYCAIDIPGVGIKKTKILIEDERHTPYIDRAEKAGLIMTRVLKD